MSQENLEVVRRLIETFNRRDFDAMLETGDPEIEVVTLVGGTYRGHAGWRQIIDQASEEVPGFQLVPRGADRGGRQGRGRDALGAARDVRAE